MENKAGPKTCQEKTLQFLCPEFGNIEGLNKTQEQLWEMNYPGCCKQGVLLWLTLVMKVGCLGREHQADRHNLFLAG